MGGEAGVIYSLLLSLTYRLILWAVGGKLSSVKGFLAAYLVAVYAPIIAFLAGISVYASSLILIVSVIFLYSVILSSDPLSARVTPAGVGLLDLSMGFSAIASTLLLVLRLLGLISSPAT